MKRTLEVLEGFRVSEYGHKIIYDGPFRDEFEEHGVEVRPETDASGVQDIVVSATVVPLLEDLNLVDSL